jgi:hypothetical protein
MLGKLIYFKINLPPEQAPKQIKERIKEKGELMNIVEIHLEKALQYEIIVRNAQSNRWLYLTDEKGRILEEKLL